MVKIDLSVDAHMLVAILEMVHTVVESVSGAIMVSLPFPEDDPDLREAWERDLTEALGRDCDFLVDVLHNNKFGKGELVLDDETAEGVLRACAAIRIKLRESALQRMSDRTLESGDIDILTLPLEQQRAFACYLFLAGLQSLIIRELDPASEDL